MNGLQIFYLVFLSGAFVFVLGLVRSEHISEKYGIFWIVILLALTLNALFPILRFFTDARLDRFISAVLCFVGIPAGLICTAMMTNYSLERRRSIQELALMRFEFDEIRGQTSAKQAAESNLEKTSQ